MRGSARPARGSRGDMTSGVFEVFEIRVASDSAGWPQVTSALATIESWIGTVAQLSPELMLALGAAALLPALAVAGLLLPRRRGMERASLTRFVRTERKRAAPFVAEPSADETWISVRAGDPDATATSKQRACISRGAVRIGSADDCDLVINGPGIAPLHAVAIPDTDGTARLVRFADERGVAVYIDGELRNEGTLTAGKTVRIGSVLLDVGETCHGLDQLPVQAATVAHADASRKVRGESSWRVSQQNRTAGGEVRS